MSNFCAVMVCSGIAILYFSYGNIAIGLFCVMAGLINLPFAIRWIRHKCED